jgi:flagellar motor switch protein FliN/FliY
MSAEVDLGASPDVAAAFVDALNQQLGGDATLTVGEPLTAIADALPDASRAVSLAFTTHEDGSDDTGAGAAIALFTDALATRLAQSASDELLVTAVTPALSAAANAIGEAGSFEIEPASPAETETQAIVDLDRALVVYPIVENDASVAGLVMYLDAEAPSNGGAHGAGSAMANAGIDAATALVLGEVEMGVTAELGRCHMTIREALALTPGAVIDLDRAAGAPVDVLVNGTVIARGEVVVIDEEFGIRISEILGSGAAAR